MTSKKTVRVSVGADGVPTDVDAQNLDKTGELPVCSSSDTLPCDDQPEAAPHQIVDDEVTVPVQSSIESTLTFELLRRQSTLVDDDEGDDGKKT